MKSSILFFLLISAFLGRTSCLLAASQQWTRVGNISEQAELMTDAVQLSNGDLVGAMYDGRLLRSTNEGLSWSVLHKALVSGTVTSLLADNSNTLYVTIDNQERGNSNKDVYFRSNDGGRTWSKLNMNIPGMEKQYYLRLYVQKLSGLLSCATSEGVFVSVDKGEKWRKLALKGTTTTQFTLIPCPQSDQLFVTSFGDNQIYQVSTTGEVKALGKLKGRSDVAHWTPTSFQSLILHCSKEICGLTNNPPFLFRSTDAGLSWDSVNFNLPITGSKNRVLNCWYDPLGTLYVSHSNGNCYTLKSGSSSWDSIQVPTPEKKIFKYLRLRTGALLALSYAGNTFTRDANTLQWSSATVPTRQRFWSLDRIGDVIVGRTLSKNYGATANSLQFSLYQPPLARNPTSKYIVNDSVAFVTQGSSFAYTSDGGSNWLTRPFFSDSSSVSVHVGAVHGQTICFVGWVNSRENKDHRSDMQMLVSTDAGLHWQIDSTAGAERVSMVDNILVHDNHIIIGTIGSDRFLHKTVGSEKFTYYDPEMDYLIGSKTCHTISQVCCNPLFFNNGDLLCIRDSAMYIRKANASRWAPLFHQPPKNDWTSLQKIVVHKNTETAELLVLSDRSNRICISVGGAPWREIEGDDNSKSDRYESFVAGNYNDNSLQLIANSASDGLWSTTVNGLSLFDQSKQTSDVEIRPNPASQAVVVTLKDQNPIISTVRVLNIDGAEQELKTLAIQNNSVSFDCSDYPSGNYVLEIQCAGSLITTTFVVQR